MRKGWRCRIMSDLGGNDRRLYLMRDDIVAGIGRKIHIVDGFTTVEHEEGDCWTLADGIPGASELIQAILDAAWEGGMRPRGFSDIKNETAALREHLSDLKTIAFHQLKIGK